MPLMKYIHAIALAITLNLLIVGCNGPDERLAKATQQAAAQQAAQNQASASLNRAVVESHRRMVESVEEARHDLVSLNRDLEVQRNTIDKERHELANDRRRDGLLAPVLSNMGLLLVTALPLVLAWYLLHGLRTQDPNEAAVSELLIQDLIAETPVLLASPRNRPALKQDSRAAGTLMSTSEEPPF